MSTTETVTAQQFIANTMTDTEEMRMEALRIMAIRTDPKAPGGPPWAWPNLDLNEGAHLDAALDEFVNTYNRIHVAVLEDVIPACWRRHPALAQEMPVQFWAWWAAHIDPKATINGAVEYYNRTLPSFQTRLAQKLLGKGAGNCRKNIHSASTSDEIVNATSFPQVGLAEYTHRGPDTRRALHLTHFGTLEGRWA